MPDRSTVSVQIRRLHPDPTSSSRSVVSVQIHEAYEIETQNLKMLNLSKNRNFDKRYSTTQVKAPPQLQKTEIETQNLKMLNLSKNRNFFFLCFRLQSMFSLAGAVRVLTVNHGFVYEPYALHEKMSWWRRCLYVTYGSLRSLYSTQELAGVSAAILNFLQRI
ncbi:hypothetical protein F2Q69_00044418 [Brassica cretica]|uniref:Uncharacterized protein n=1 Tax=Brassica cretica TaxID=69181 RepID=A0A8S9NLU7_BRACR|nr:hypothetical protein F2Q69_00044418 [Brassica cretica]